VNPARQFIRWAIPGAILFLAVAINEAILALVTDRTRAGVVALNNVSAGLAALVVAIGVPVGFLLHNAYFVLGGDDLGERIRDGLPARMAPRPGWPEGSNIAGGVPPDWRSLRALMYWGDHGIDGAQLRDEYDDRSDIYHALGGTRYALTTATAMCILYNVYVHGRAFRHHPYAVVTITVLWIGLTLFGRWILGKQRARTLNALIEVLADGLASRPTFAFQPVSTDS
jgi:hypothetical protein